MSGCNPVTPFNAPVETKTATIDNGASLSGAIDLECGKLAWVAIPDTWTPANLTFQVSIDGTNYFDLYDAFGTEYTVQAAASRVILLLLQDFWGFRYLKIRSGISGSAVNQGGARTLTLGVVV